MWQKGGNRLLPLASDNEGCWKKMAVRSVELYRSDAGTFRAEQYAIDDLAQELVSSFLLRRGGRLASAYVARGNIATTALPIKGDSWVHFKETKGQVANPEGAVVMPGRVEQRRPCLWLGLGKHRVGIEERRRPWSLLGFNETACAEVQAIDDLAQ